MNDRSLYVGNFPYSTTEDDLAELFSPFGEVVRVVIIADHGTGQSKGYGFVELDSADGATKAKAEMDNHEYNGRPLRVNDATPRAKSDGPNANAADDRPPHRPAKPGQAPRRRTAQDDPGLARETPLEEETEPFVSRGYRNSFYPELVTD